MRVLYDASPLLMRSAGVKNYHYSLLDSLAHVAPPGSIRLFPYLKGIGVNTNEASNFPFFYTWARIGGIVTSNGFHIPYAHPQASRAHLFHVTPHLFNPPTWPVLTSMIHDATPLTHAECHLPSTIKMFRKFVRKVVPRLKGVIVPSQAVKRDLVSQVGMHSASIEVIPHGVDLDFFESSPEQQATARREYGLANDFVLFLGSMEPRKNLLRLAEAHALLPASLQEKFPLIIAGAAGWNNDEIRGVLRKSKHAKTIGYVPRKLLPSLYAAASVFAFPSLYEGFGMPLLEAMAAGTPVLTSSTSAMPEVIGDAGVAVDPYDADAMAEGLRGLLEDSNAAGALASRARDRARGFTWEKSAQHTWEFFEKAASNAG